MVNTEPSGMRVEIQCYYNILNIVVNTEPMAGDSLRASDYNILNIVVNTERSER